MLAPIPFKVGIVFRHRWCSINPLREPRGQVVALLENSRSVGRWIGACSNTFQGWDRMSSQVVFY